MSLPFFNRHQEIDRLRRLTARRDGSLAVLYGRRRCGKSRLLREILPPGRGVSYVGDDRDSPLQRATLAAEIARLIQGFDQVAYPDWDALFARFFREALAGTVLVLDEFPALVAAARELPSILQRYIDREGERGIHLILAGSSQRMMQGLVLDRTAPLFGRAREILKILPLEAGWILPAFKLRNAVAAIEMYSVWGGTPRYWELAAECEGLAEALRDLVLSPLGVLHEEPSRLLLDDLRDTAQAASILSVIGAGSNRASEIAGRLGKPVTALARPLQRLIEMDLIARETPFGTTAKTSKRTLYRIADPFLAFWFRFTEPNRSQIEAGRLAAVVREVASRLPHHVGQQWEALARASVPRLELFGRSFGPAQRWWGPGLDRQPLEVDLVAESDDGKVLLVGEAKWSVVEDPARALAQLAAKAERLPFLAGREVLPALWLKEGPRGKLAPQVITPGKVLGVMR